MAHRVAAARADGGLPERTVHNDAKVDNLLFDDATGAGLCLVDLDTVGPGTVLFDVGDLVRSGAARAAEDGGPAAGTSTTPWSPPSSTATPAPAPGSSPPARSSSCPSPARSWPWRPRPGSSPTTSGATSTSASTDPGHNLRRARNQLGLLELLR